MSRKLRAVDLFAGAGGLREGLKEADFEIVVASEKQKDAILTYKKNHPETQMIEGDIVEIGDSDFSFISGSCSLSFSSRLKD